MQRARSTISTTFEPEHIIQPIYTGGDVALSQDGRILATCLGEDAVLTDLATGELLARIDGVRDPSLSILTSTHKICDRMMRS